MAADLSWLAEQVTAGDLDVEITWRDSWKNAEDAFEALLERTLHGKAVLDIH